MTSFDMCSNLITSVHILYQDNQLNQEESFTHIMVIEQYVDLIRTLAPSPWFHSSYLVYFYADPTVLRQLWNRQV